MFAYVISQGNVSSQGVTSKNGDTLGCYQMKS